MKIVRFTYGAQDKWGVLNEKNEKKINIINGNIFANYNNHNSYDNYNNYEVSDEYVSLDNVQLLAPCIPSKGVCIGLNYYDHAREMNLKLPAEPLMFLKPSSSLNHPGGIIEYPAISQNLHYEAEMAIVIKKQARHVSVENAYDYILGYTCANDVTARDLQQKDGQWTRGKSFDTFMPLGPYIETDIDPHNINITLYVNNVACQSSNTGNLIFKVPELLVFVTQVMTLYPGDVILTGTPAGVGPMQAGDTVAVELEGIGRLENTVSKADKRSCQPLL
ncbi:MAG TPA: fumarylacetoacetate hydrolase family protein [Methylomusa anaerophila]|uniref:Ureidoglycolate lyase n=1 Tax=Methylomusa anaerophila TaxID=1930071 RepID=A0A348AGU7_9FIRM|nr:fumarylacetoacetate hydrolase family protein [Methylomusa anaerophila]BBB90295.1 ureidoglycolate lyase [Methylomusa anaerophila]HML89360.1 fumarylacetoacetate hydrolase family protein [Methylomusa anaerophila]